MVRLTLAAFLGDGQAEKTAWFLCDRVVRFYLTDGRQTTCYR